MSSDDDLLPRLPPELEEEIFKVCFAIYNKKRESPLQLFLISKRVSEWLIPQYYNLVTNGYLSWWPWCINENTLKLYGHHVHHFHSSEDFDVHLLSFCPNIYNLAIWASISQEDAEVISNLRNVTHLAISITPLLKLNINWDPFFANITHLDISNDFKFSDGLDRILSHFVALTHLAIVDNVDEDEELMKRHMAATRKVESLQAFVLVTSEYGGGLTEMGSYLNDAKVVRLRVGESYLDDWWGGGEMWVFVDEVIAKRQLSGKMWTELVFE